MHPDRIRPGNRSYEGHVGSPVLNRALFVEQHVVPSLAAAGYLPYFVH
jgi:hypothetical protein